MIRLCVCLLMIFLLFTLRYLIIELKINLLILLKEPSREKALLTLHVMTEMRFLLRKNGSAVAQWYSAWLETKGPWVRASSTSLCCDPWARHIYPSLVLVQPRKIRPYITERLLMGRKESNQINKQNLLRKKLKKIMHGHVKMYVLRWSFLLDNIFLQFGTKL